MIYCSGAIIGDIKQNNLKNILVEVDVSPTSHLQEEEILWYELSFLPRKGSEVTKVTGTVSLMNTEDDSLVLKQNVEAVIALTIQQSADFDTEIIQVRFAR